MNGTTLEVGLEVDARYYLDGRPGFVRSLTDAGFAGFVFDGAAFATNVQRDEVHDWEPCPDSKLDLETARARAAAARLGIKI